MRMADSSEGGWLTVEHYENYAVNLDFAAERESLQNRYSLYSQPSGDHFISETSKSLSVHSRSLKKKIFAWTSLNQSIIEICQAHQQFLGFQWPLGGRGHRHYCFTLFPFGLSSAPYLFIIFFSSTSAPLERRRYPFSSIFGRYERAVKRIHYYTALFGNCWVWLG